MRAHHGAVHPGRTLLALAVGLGLVLGALGIVTIAAPEAAPFILLAAFAAEAIGAVVLYVVQRRHHW